MGSLSIPGSVYRYRLAADTTLKADVVQLWVLDVFVGGKLEKALGCSCKDGARRSEVQEQAVPMQEVEILERKAW